MLATLLALLSLGAPQTVTLTIRAATAEHAVRAIAEHTGVPLQTRPPIQHQMLLIDVQDVPLDDLLKHLAQVVRGEWVDGKDGRVLTRSSALQSKLVQLQRTARGAEIDESLRKASQGLRPLSAESSRQLVSAQLEAERSWSQVGDSQSIELIGRLRREQPDHRALIQLLTEIGGEVLAGADLDRVVYSNRPNTKQVRLPAACDAVLASMRAQWMELDEEVRRQSGRPRQSPFATAERVLVSVGRGRAIFTVPGVWGEWVDVDFDEQSPPREDPYYPAQPFELGEKGRWMAEWWRARIGFRVLPSANGDIRQMLLSPSEQPRAGALIFDSLRALARHDRMPLVAWVPAILSDRIEMKVSTEATLSRAESALWESRIDLRRKDGWLHAAPRQPIDFERYEKPREPVQRFVRRAEEARAIRLLDVATLGYELDLLTGLREANMLGYASGFIGASALVNLLGSMTEPQRQAAASEQGLAVSQLAPPQKRLAEKAVYDSYDWPVQPYEVTEAFPDGVPGDGRFFLKIEQEEVALPWSPTLPTQSAPPLNPVEMARHLQNLKSPEDGSSQWARVDRFRFGTSAAYTLILSFGKRGALQVEVREHPTLTGEGVSFEQLPAEFRAKVNEAAKRLPPPR